MKNTQRITERKVTEMLLTDAVPTDLIGVTHSKVKVQKEIKTRR